MKLSVKTVLALMLAGSIVSGCAGPTKSEYTVFAQAGAGYAAAVDKLLTAAGLAQVDSTSWTLVMEKNVTGMDDKTYSAKSKADLDRLKEISRLRVHAKLLARYFGLLESLATSDAPEKTKTAIEGVVKSLESLFVNLPPATSALPPFGKLVVDLKIRAALKSELEARKDVIRKHLQIQEALLAELTGDISHALTLEKGTKEQQLVIDPIVNNAPLKNPEKWVSTRREVIYMPVTVEELNSSSNAAKKLREAFEGLLSGEKSLGRINALITDIESILDVVDAINS